MLHAVKDGIFGVNSAGEKPRVRVSAGLPPHKERLALRIMTIIAFARTFLFGRRLNSEELGSALQNLLPQLSNGIRDCAAQWQIFNEKFASAGPNMSISRKDKGITIQLRFMPTFRQGRVTGQALQLSVNHLSMFVTLESCLAPHALLSPYFASVLAQDPRIQRRVLPR